MSTTTSSQHSSSGAFYCPECGGKWQNDKFWIQCDHCSEWYHGDCVDVQAHQSISIDKFYCFHCESEVGPSTNKKVTNNHRHNIYEEEPSDRIQSGTTAFIIKLKAKTFDTADYSTVQGNQLTVNYLLKHGFKKPIFVENKNGLDMILPPDDFGVEQVISLIGGFTELDVIDSKRQLNVRLPLVELARCINNDRRNQILNCISLEVSKTRLGKMIKPPAIVNKLSWVENGWPEVDMKPNVSKYCLMSMRDSYTDFHIDFGGTSVWYHVLLGEKIFYLIEPTPANLAAYEHWMSRTDQNEVFLPDRLNDPNECKKMILQQGQTLFIPTGWIHAVLTTKDSLVFGGNFLHSLNIKLQLEIYDMENRLRIESKFLFPFFELTNWYAIPIICELLQHSFSKRPPPLDVIEGVESLGMYLKKWNAKSKEENPLQNGDFSPYAPRGLFNTRKLMNDLTRSLHAAQNRLGIKKENSIDGID
ncbi:lysine-specific demethylase 7B-like [Panonychus citri]|uniref:lysine-specific demethylase 7B-like n=1 Tax=Panonychus citri TaxID=50023 RepID=UPI0023078B4F|nr:lysine-specific demethylase 7B-like [Panonychus citri]